MSLIARRRGLRLLLALLSALGSLLAAEGLYRAALWRRRAASGRDADFEILAFGSSVATGGLHPRAFSFAPIMGKMFDDRIQGRPVFVDIVSEPGSSYYSDYLALRDRLAFRDKSRLGVALIHPTGNRTPHEPRHCRSCFVLLDAAKSGFLLRSYFLSDLIYRVEKALDLRGVRDGRFYEFYLRRIIEECRAAGVVPILSTAALDVAGMEPDLDLRDPDRDARLLEPGLRLEKRGAWRAALAYYAGLQAGQPEVELLLRYRIARCEEALGRYGRARDDYWQAADGGAAISFRQTNRLVRSLGIEYGVPVVDAVAALEHEAPHRLIGGESFADWGHPNAMGQIVLARAFARQVSALTSAAVRRDFRSPEDLYRVEPYPAKLRACGLVADGLWILKSSVGYPYAAMRLETARRYFQEASALAPSDAAAWLGLALTASAKANDYVLRDFDLRWFASSPSEGAVCFEPSLSDEVWARLSADFRSSGVSEPALRRLAALQRDGALRAKGPAASVAPYRGF